MNGRTAPERVVSTGDLIGSGETAAILCVDKSTLSRRVSTGKLKPLTRLDGPNGPFVFARTDIEALAKDGAK